MGVVTNSIIYAAFLTVISGKEFVPVLQWGTSHHSTGESVSALRKLSTNEYLDFVLKKVKVDKPLVLVFVEENISVEDFSWRDVDENGAFPLLSNLTKSSAEVTFLPSVHNPYKALRQLRRHEYIWKSYSEDDLATLSDDEPVVLVVKLNEPDYLQDRPGMLRNHDVDMYKIFEKVSSERSNILAIYTGHHSSWIDAETEYNRVKREEKEAAPSAEENDIFVDMDKNNKVLIAFKKPIYYTIGDEKHNITELISIGINEGTAEQEWLNLDMAFKLPTGAANRLEIDFNFTAAKKGAWALSELYINEKKNSQLRTNLNIAAPALYSYFCAQPVVFTGTHEEKAVSLEFTNFQIQPYFEDGRFGPPIDCVPYFSAAIWSGIFIVFILSIVLAWGIVMIMDINTMDRFDDPKGKTITITATD